jgi:hypothetical protein
MTKGSFAGALAIRICSPSTPSFPAEVTTTTPLNQSCSRALSSGSHRKLLGVSEWSEKLATRMLY